MNPDRYNNSCRCTPADSLAYLRHTVYEDLNAAVNELEGIASENAALAQPLKELADFIDEAACKIDHEIDIHRLQHVTHYSNGIPIVVDYYGPAERLEDGTERRGKKQLINHPTVDSTPYITLLEDVVIIPIEDIRRIGTEI